jgi:hypothetical protein
MASEHLASLPVATAFYASVMCHELVCSLLVSFENSHTLADLFDEVPPLSPLVISTAIDPRANAALVWDPNQSGARSAVGPEASDASRLSGCHLAILPGLSKVECGYYLDGFVLMLGATDWQAMKDALRQDRGYTIECGGAFKQFLIARS